MRILVIQKVVLVSFFIDLFIVAFIQITNIIRCTSCVIACGRMILVRLIGDGLTFYPHTELKNTEVKLLKRSLFAASLTLSLLSACAAPPEAESVADATSDPSAPATLKDVVYKRAETEGGEKDLHLDLYQSGEACGEARPVVLIFHGGGFRRGHKGHGPWDGIATDLAADGYAAITINYRLSGDRPVLSDEFEPVFEGLLNAREGNVGPRQRATGKIIVSAIEDATDALRWIEINADTHCMDASNIGVWGGSAGAYIALHVAYLLDEYDIDAPRPAVAVNFWGRALDTSMIQANEAPLLTVHGTEDPVVPFQAGLDIRQAASEVGLPQSFYAVTGAGHSWNSIPADTEFYENETMIDVARRFLDAHLKGGEANYRFAEITP